MFIIAALNYAEHIKVNTNLMILLVTIALYVNAQTQKTHQQKVEPLDGSTVAFDKEAFVNLNAIVNELVKKDSVTIPGNLIVKGTTVLEDAVTAKKQVTFEDAVTAKKKINIIFSLV